MKEMMLLVVVLSKDKQYQCYSFIEILYLNKMSRLMSRHFLWEEYSFPYFFNIFANDVSSENLTLSGMKIFFLLLSIYMVAISIIPCKAGDDCCEDYFQNTISQNTTPPQKAKSKEQRKEPCSPLFPCSSHCIFIVAHSYELPTYWTTVDCIYKFEYKHKPISNFSPFVWRPPLLG